jgi:hypothetical protein
MVLYRKTNSVSLEINILMCLDVNCSMLLPTCNLRNIIILLSNIKLNIFRIPIDGPTKKLGSMELNFYEKLTVVQLFKKLPALCCMFIAVFKRPRHWA